VGVRYSAVHRELESMHAAGLALAERAGSRLLYRANSGHSQAALVRGLLEPSDPGELGNPAHDERVRGWLRVHGAPLWAPLPRKTPPLETVVAEGLGLAHRDATVALVLPILLWRQREHVDYDRLIAAAARADERQALGFFLELTGKLSGDSRPIRAAQRLRDGRRRRVRLFFSTPHGRFVLALARANTPPLARRWGYLMNMTLDGFTTAFAKHTGAAA
jgi:hypothetical protein